VVERKRLVRDPFGNAIRILQQGKVADKARA